MGANSEKKKFAPVSCKSRPHSGRASSSLWKKKKGNKQEVIKVLPFKSMTENMMVCAHRSLWRLKKEIISELSQVVVPGLWKI